MTTGKTVALTRRTFVGKVTCLLFNMLSRLVIAFLASKEQGSFNFMAAVTICSDFGAPQNKVWHCFHCFPIYLPWSDGTRWHDILFWMLSFKPAFSLSSFTFINRLFNYSLLFCLKGGVTCISEVINISPSNLELGEILCLCFIQPSISHDVLCI